jgi:hypothetical protein
MKTRIIGLAALACMMLFGPLTAQAVPVEWTLNGFTFVGGGTASGSFVYDADTNTYSSVNITTTPGTLAGASYTDVSPGFANSATVGLFVTTTVGDLTGTPALALFYGAGLTNAGGAVAITLNGNVEGTCNNATCTAGTGTRSLVAGALLNGVVVPTPTPGTQAIPTLAEWAMLTLVLMLGLAGVISLRRKGLQA